MRPTFEWQPAPSPALLFVYGTLRRGSNHPMARWLAFHARYIGNGRLKGRLYHLGQYPGAIVSDRADEWVRGDLYEMRGAHRLLARLDHYEGVEKGRKRLTEYQRVVVAIERDDGEVQQAWVYRYRLPINHFKRLITGDFLRQRRRLPHWQI